VCAESSSFRVLFVAKIVGVNSVLKTTTEKKNEITANVTADGHRTIKLENANAYWFVRAGVSRTRVVGRSSNDARTN